VIDKQITHKAFSDESSHNQGRYRSIAVVSLHSSIFEEINALLLASLHSSGLEGKELKWQKVRTNIYGNAAIKVLQKIEPYLLGKALRIDSIIWDTQDSRHRIVGRDDRQNFARMYYHQLFNCLDQRWPSNTNWGFYPDETSEIEWGEFIKIMDKSSSTYTILGKLPPEIQRTGYSFRIVDFSQIKSINEPLIQLADLFSGIGEYSWNNFSNLMTAMKQDEGQFSLFGEQTLSNSERERCKVIRCLDKLCKQHKWSVSLKRSGGFMSYKPEMPINFWKYTPQHDKDKAPVKD